MSAFAKDLFRMIRGNAGRFIAMLCIIAVGICFVTGIGGISPKVLNSIDEFYQKQNVPDVIIKSTSQAGFTQEQIAAVTNAENVSGAVPLTQIDDKDTNTRMAVVDFDSGMNKFVLKKGRFPEATNEIAVEQSGNHIKKHAVGSTMEIQGQTFTVTGIVQNPLILATEGDVNQMDTDEFLTDIVYFSSNHNPFKGMLPVTDVYVRFKNMPGYFDEDYIKEANAGIRSLEKQLQTDSSAVETASGNQAAGTDDFTFLNLEKEYGYAYIKNIMDRVDTLALAFPLFFVLVVGLVTLTNMSRLIDEERQKIGCLTSLGYNRGKIISKYLAFAAISTAAGEATGLATGVRIIPDIVYQAVKSAVYLPEHMTDTVYLPMGLISSALMFAAVLGVTLFTAFRTVSERPAALFHPKAQKPGRRILMERIPFLWNRLSFRYKSTWRNIFRFKSRFWMIVISITGSTLLVMAALGLYDCVGDLEAINYVSMAILVFALALSVLVLYNIITMNIGERTREIATLDVLGYLGREIDGFIYREIVIMATIGILAGIPAGTVFLYFIFKELDFGGLDEIHAFTYLLAFALSELFVFLVVLLTRRHVRRVDMNESLKSLE